MFNKSETCNASEGEKNIALILFFNYVCIYLYLLDAQNLLRKIIVAND